MSSFCRRFRTFAQDLGRKTRHFYNLAPDGESCPPSALLPSSPVCAMARECLAPLPTLEEEAVVLIELRRLLGPPKKPWSKGAGCLSSECVFRRGPGNTECRAKELQVSRLPRRRGSGWGPRSESAGACGLTWRARSDGCDGCD